MADENKKAYNLEDVANDIADAHNYDALYTAFVEGEALSDEQKNILRTLAAKLGEPLPEGFV